MSNLLGDDVLNTLCSITEMARFFRVDGIHPSSWFMRMGNSKSDLPEHEGYYMVGGIKKTKVQYKVVDVVLYCEAKGAIITAPSETKKQLELSKVKLSAAATLRDVKAEIAEQREVLEKLRKDVIDAKALIDEYQSNAPFGDLRTISTHLPVTSKEAAHRLYTRDEVLQGAHKHFRVSGVYFLILQDEIVYVGQSVSVYTRALSHATTKDFDSISVVECDKEFLDVLESLYILAFNPRLNGRPVLGLKKLSDLYTTKVKINECVGARWAQEFRAKHLVKHPEQCTEDQIVKANEYIQSLEDRIERLRVSDMESYT